MRVRRRPPVRRGSQRWRPRCVARSGRRRRSRRTSRNRTPSDRAASPATRPSEAVTETIRLPLNHCPDCGEVVKRITDNQPIFQTDLPPIKPIVRRFETQRGWCPQCRKMVSSRHPEQTDTATGPPIWTR
jgi:hypothetical protein